MAKSALRIASDVFVFDFFLKGEANKLKTCIGVGFSGGSKCRWCHFRFTRAAALKIDKLIFDRDHKPMGSLNSSHAFSLLLLSSPVTARTRLLMAMCPFTDKIRCV